MILWRATHDVCERLLTALSVLEIQIEGTYEQRRLRSIIRVARASIDAGHTERALYMFAEGTESLATVLPRQTNYWPHGVREPEVARPGRAAMIRVPRPTIP